MLITLTFIYFVSLGTHIFVDKPSTELQLPLHISKLIMNGNNSAQQDLNS